MPVPVPTHAHIILSTASVREDIPVKVEPILAELNRIRQDLDPDPEDMEWVALHHAFCFISYKINEFQDYLNEQERLNENSGNSDDA